jgi:hypothetical protein
MEGVLALLCVFGCPVAIIAVVNHYKLKKKQLEAGIGEAEQKLLARCDELEQRVQTLETIACEGDLEAAAKIRALGRVTGRTHSRTVASRSSARKRRAAERAYEGT